MRFALTLCLAAVPALTSICPAEEIIHAIDFPKGDGAWTVNFSFPRMPNKPTGGRKSAKNPPYVKKIAILRQGEWRRDILTFSDGSTRRQWWCENPPVLLFERGNSQIAAMKSDAASDRRYDGASLAWIDAKSFVAVKPFEGKSCQYYEMDVVEFTDEEKIVKKLRAWIDPKTHFPVAFDNGSSTASFDFLAGNPPPLKVPEKFAEELKRNADYYAPAQKNGKR